MRTPWLYTLGLLILLMLVPPRPSGATNYTFLTLDVPYPRTSETAVTGFNMAGTAVGRYLDAGHHDQGFFWPFGGHAQVLLNVTPRAINRGGLIVGSAHTGDHLQGFAYQDGTFMAFDAHPPRIDEGPSTILTEVLGVNDLNHMVGSYRSAGEDRFHGFRYIPQLGTFETFDMPGAEATVLQAITNAGTMVGYFHDASFTPHALRIDNGSIR